MLAKAILDIIRRGVDTLALPRADLKIQIGRIEQNLGVDRGGGRGVGKPLGYHN